MEEAFQEKKETLVIAARERPKQKKNTWKGTVARLVVLYAMARELVGETEYTGKISQKSGH